MMERGSPGAWPSHHRLDRTEEAPVGGMAGGDRRPAGFPACRRCPWRGGGAPLVCWSCLSASGPRPAAVPGTARGCPVCAQDLPAGVRCPNRSCRGAARGFSVVFAVGRHEGALRRAIARYKYRGEGWWCSVLAALLAGHVLAHPTWFEDFDLLVGMPAYTGPGARRDWDPVGRVVARLGVLLDGWDVRTGVLAKRVETPAMTGRGGAERRAIAAGPLRAALAVTDPAAVEGARVLVVDDVLTGGSSLGEAAWALRRAGAVEVAGLVLARRAWHGRVPRAPGRPGGPTPGRAVRGGGAGPRVGRGG